jgi:hypothetical protein
MKAVLRKLARQRTPDARNLARIRRAQLMEANERFWN